MRRARAFLLTSVTLFLAACAAGSTAQAPTSAPPPPAPAPASPVASVIPGSSSAADPQPAVEAARADAAAHLGVSPASLKLEQVEPRQWADSSLGCPKPGQMYSQIVTPGYVVIVSGSGRQLEYHADTRGRVVLCQER
jgi:hypothetical protein